MTKLKIKSLRGLIHFCRTQGLLFYFSGVFQLPAFLACVLLLEVVFNLLTLKDGYLCRIPLSLQWMFTKLWLLPPSVCIRSRADTQVLQTRWLKTRHKHCLTLYILEDANRNVTRNTFPWKLETKSPSLTPPSYLMPWQFLAYSYRDSIYRHHATSFLCLQMDALPWQFGLRKCLIPVLPHLNYIQNTLDPKRAYFKFLQHFIWGLNTL